MHKLLIGILIIVILLNSPATSANDVNAKIEFLLSRIETRKEEWQYWADMRETAKQRMELNEKLANKARAEIRELDPTAILIDSDGYMGEWWVSRYYTPIPDQPRYYGSSYEEDFEINCFGNCMSTASTLNLSSVTPYTTVACPPELPFGTRLGIKEIGRVTCVDRGGAIKGRRLDLWAGVGMDGLNRILSTQGGLLKVYNLSHDQ